MNRSIEIMTDDLVKDDFYGLRLTLRLHDIAQAEQEKWVGLWNAAVSSLTIAGATHLCEHCGNERSACGHSESEVQS